MGTITKVKTKSSKNNTTSKMAKSANKKKFILRYWMDERINYKAENENYIIERNTKKMTNMGSLYGTNGFYIDITPKKTYKILSDGKGYDFKSLKNYSNAIMMAVSGQEYYCVICNPDPGFGSPSASCTAVNPGENLVFLPNFSEVQAANCNIFLIGEV